MLIEAEQVFSLPFPGDQAAALAFLRDPARSLSRLRFLHELTVSTETPAEVRAVLVVQMPMLGSVTLPLHSRLIVTPGGARLESLPIADERAWIELSGEGSTDSNPGGTTLEYSFHFTAHLEAPSAEQWGGAAFEKMVRAAAARTLTRLAQELPAGISAALPAQPDT
ncbi:DUF3809 domain-containing protein [Deinococcus ruber]|uniref:DUF3809 domain-containing protein n=1 Tax=Deinococcus ruber TaxID=1848197 RepID=A0A918CKB1_9DEIO|nr:DUF3809 domain-containing protein [Deinococcus ruber]GGR26091.1 hypothetical protein GCM10008957_42180 [Deinococcus ruber]